MSIIKVLHIISGSDSGGAKTHLLNLCKYSTKLFESTIGCINKGSMFDSALDLQLNTVMFEENSRFDFRVVNKIKQYIKFNNIDIVNFHGANPNFLFALLKNRIDIPAVTTIHSDYRYDFMNNRLKYMFFTPLNIMALKKFDNYICVSGRIKNLLNEKGFKGNKFIVYNGINKNIIISNNREKVRQKYGIPSDAFVYTMVARLHPVKNHSGLFMAASKLIKEYNDIFFICIGDGESETFLKKEVADLKIESKIIFTGYQNNVLDFINAGDINILTSFNETFPIVILEGAMTRKTAICSDVGDIKNILNDDTGFIVDPYSTDDIYAKIKNAYQNKEKLKQMGDNLFDIVDRQYNMDAFCLRYYKAYESILG